MHDALDDYSLSSASEAAADESDGHNTDRCHVVSSADSDEDVSYDDLADGFVAVDAPEGPSSAGSTNSNSGKLWSLIEFPEGTKGCANYDMANLQAAQQWACPCIDRRSCIGLERLSLLQLYEHRKHFRTTAHLQGGYRDACRKALEERFDKENGTFIRAFKVGPLVDCCAASAGLAAGVSFATWANARVDAKKNLPFHEGRKRNRSNVESFQRGHLNAYIRDLRASMEGPKGGSDPKDKWRTDKLPLSKRWEQYKESRLKRGLPVIGEIVARHATQCPQRCQYVSTQSQIRSVLLCGHR